MSAIRSPHRNLLAVAATIVVLLGPVACRTQPQAPPAAAETTPVVPPSADAAAPSSPHGARDVQELMQAKLLLEAGRASCRERV